jgi:hypothetical protein
MGGVFSVERSPTSSKRAKSTDIVEGGMCFRFMVHYVVYIVSAVLYIVKKGDLSFVCACLTFLSLTCSGGGIGARRFSD